MSMLDDDKQIKKEEPRVSSTTDLLDIFQGLAPESITEDVNQLKRQTPEINNGMSLFNRNTKCTSVDQIDGTRYRVKNGNYEVEFKNKSDIKNVGILKAIAFLCLKLYETNSKYISVPMEEYAKYLGIDDLEYAYRKARKDIEALTYLRFTNRGKDSIDGLAIWGGKYKVTREKITFYFSDVFMERANKYPGIPTSLNALQTNDQKFPNAYRIFCRLERHAYYNFRKSNQNIINLRTLYECCDLPSLEVAEKRRQVRPLIIDRIERDLDHLVEIGAMQEWYYCGKAGKKLTDTELDQLNSDWRINLEARIHFVLNIDKDLYPENLNKPVEKKTLPKTKKQYRKTSKHK